MKQCGWGRKRAKGAGVMAGILAGIFGVFLGCGGCGQGRQNAQDVSGAVPAYQFAPGFGIIAQSPYPVYVLEDENGYAVSKDGVKVELVRGMMQDNALIAELRILDYRKVSRGDDRGADSWIYDIRCFGPGIPDTGYTAERMGTHSENRDTGDSGYRETLAEFCTVSKKIDTEKGLDGYYFQIGGLDEKLDFSWTQAKGYEQIQDMEGAVTHKGRWMLTRAVPAGEKGLAVELYAFSEKNGEQVEPGRINPLSSQKEEITLLGKDKKVYRQMGESLPMVMNQGAEVEYGIDGSDGRIWYFDVPSELQKGSFLLSVPSVTLISSEESRVIILPLNGEEAGTEDVPDRENVPDREILFQEHGLEIVSIEATGGKGTLGPGRGAGGGERTKESQICRLELSGKAAEGGGQMEMVLMRVKTKGASDKAEWLNIMPEKESISDPDLGGRFIFNLPYEKGDDSITFQLWHPYFVWEQSFSLEVSAS